MRITNYEDLIMKRAMDVFAEDGLKFFGIDKKVMIFTIWPPLAGGGMLPKKYFQPRIFDGMGDFYGHLIPISLN